MPNHYWRSAIDAHLLAIGAKPPEKNALVENLLTVDDFAADTAVPCQILSVAQCTQLAFVGRMPCARKDGSLWDFLGEPGVEEQAAGAAGAVESMYL
ncbi:unnamed protein product [Symbiodinium natans]|uniref:Uncharacterized protein n=1 Tax=Symbiodinium natans TaxID=878477 RepID=A0A812NRH3_9DINO|nr:unnamed protein product [Symbiodinium natans]